MAHPVATVRDVASGLTAVATESLGDEVPRGLLPAAGPRGNTKAAAFAAAFDRNVGIPEAT